MKKRGQITLFIILGILILLAVVGFFVIRSIVVKEEIIEEIVPVIVTIPLEFEPIRTFTQECLESIGEEAVKIIGDHGGYIDIVDYGMTTSSTNPTEADAIEFAPDSGLYVPYWWYLKAPNKCAGNCLFSSLRPPLYRTNPGDRSIEAQIDIYIEEEIGACLNDYEAFEAQGFDIIPLGEMKSTTRVTATDVSLSLNYPLRIELADRTGEIRNFYATVPVNLRRIYNFATDITNAQIEHKFIEKQMVDLIHVFSGLDPNKLPPTSASVFGTEPSIMWLKTTVKERLQEILMTYVPAFQIYNTLNFRKRIMPNPIQAQIYQASELPINLSTESQPYTDLAATFSYLAWWPLYFDINSDGEIIKGQQAISDLMELFLLGLTRYMTVYDLSYPVVVEIQDPGALNNEGYLFRFALEANIRNNKEIDERFQGLEGITLFESSLLCNDNQRNSGNITIKIVDEFTNEPIPDVSVGFKCGEEGCPMGITGSDGILKTKFPVCFDGLLVLRHSDYFTPTNYLTTFFNQSREVPTIKLNPYIDKRVDVSRYIFDRANNALIPNTMPLEPAEEALIIMTRISDFAGDPKHVALAKVFGNQTENSTLRLVPGTYEVSIDLFHHEPVIIPEDEREAGTWPFQEEYTIPRIEINDSYMRGGAVLDEATGYFIVPAYDLYEDNILTFFAADTYLPGRIEEIYDAGTTNTLSLRYRTQLEPQFT